METHDMEMLWEQMGFIRWPISFAALMIAALSLYSTAQVYKPGAWANLKTKVFIDGVLFWGGFAVVAGLLGSVLGVIISFQSIEQAGAVAYNHGRRHQGGNAEQRSGSPHFGRRVPDLVHASVPLAHAAGEGSAGELASEETPDAERPASYSARGAFPFGSGALKSPR